MVTLALKFCADVKPGANLTFTNKCEQTQVNANKYERASKNGCIELKHVRTNAGYALCMNLDKSDANHESRI